MTLRLRSPAVYYSLFVLQVTTLLAILSLSRSAGPALAGLLGGVPLIALGLYAGRANADTRHPAYGRLTRGGVVLALFILVAMLAAGALVNALLVFLLLIQAARNITLSTRRDLHFCLLVTLVCLLFAAAQSRGGAFLFYMGAYTLAGGMALAAAYQDERMQQAVGRGAAPGRLRRWSAIGSMSALLTVVALGLYFIVPRPPAAHLGVFPAGGGHYYDDRGWLDEATNPAGAAAADPALDDAGRHPAVRAASGHGVDVPAQGAAGYGGFGARLDIDDPGRHGGTALFDGIVLYVQADRPLYLRGRVFDRFDGRRWRRSRPGTEKLELKHGAIRFMDDAGAAVVQQTVNVAHDLPGYLYGADRVAAVRFPGRVIARDADRGLQVPGRLRAGTTYSVRSVIAAAAGRPASGAEPLAGPDDYLQLPRDLPERIGRLAAEVVAGATGVAAAARLERFLRTEYEYSFSTIVSSQGYIPLDGFLFETRRGHCEYFATAMAVMLRTQGIPARLATGFSATTYNPLTGYYEVRALDAHAWVEAWFPEHGWVLFEPTAFYALPQPRADATTGEQLSAYLDDLARIREILPEPGRAPGWGALAGSAWQQLAGFLRQVVYVIRQAATLLIPWFLHVGPPVLGSALAAGLAWYCLRFPWLRLRSRQRVQRGRRVLPPQAFARLCYRELETLFAGFGCPRDPAWTVEEYIDRLKVFDARLAEAAGSIGASYARVRYAVQPPAFEPDREQLYSDYLRASRVTPVVPALPGNGVFAFLRGRWPARARRV